jgi:hypothetical protein
MTVWEAFGSGGNDLQGYTVSRRVIFPVTGTGTSRLEGVSQAEITTEV